MTDDIQTRFAEAQSELALAKTQITQLESRLAAMTSTHESQTQLQKQLVQRLEALHQLDIAILSAESLENLAQMALTHVIQLLPCFRASISTIDPTAQTVYILAVHSEVDTLLTAGKTYPLDEKYISGVSHDPYVVEDDLSQSKNPNIQQLYNEGIRSILLVPLRIEDKLVGLLSLHSIQNGHFTKTNIQIAIEVAYQIAIGIEKKIRSDELALYAKRMEILHNIDQGLHTSQEIPDLIAKTLKDLRVLIPCERIAINLIDKATQEVAVFVADSEFAPLSLARTRLLPFMLEGFDNRNAQLREDLRLIQDHKELIKLLLDRGYLTNYQVLLVHSGEIKGNISLASTKLGFFTPQYQEIAIEVAAQLSIVIHQMQLAEALERHASELEQRVAERTSELQTSKDQIEAILHNSLDGILLIDRDLRIQQANPAVNHLLMKELNDKEIVNLMDLVHPVYANEIRTSIEQALLEQTPVPIEVQAYHLDGRKRDIELNFGHIPGDGFVSTLHDITARKTAEAALKKALELERELVVAKSHFVSVATHEFRTPLATILAMTETLSDLRDRLTTAQIDQKLERIRQNVQHMAALMEDTLQLTRIQSGRMDYRPVNADFHALCHSVIEEFEEAGSGRNRFVYSSPESPLIAKFDPRLMKQVTINLLSNALKYSPADKPVKVSLAQESSEIILSVTDQGIGIPEEDLQHLFEPFHRASNTGSINGTGLGLSITKQIVESHRGTITVESLVGQGTTFTVVIPAA